MKTSGELNVRRRAAAAADSPTNHDPGSGKRTRSSELPSDAERSDATAGTASAMVAEGDGGADDWNMTSGLRSALGLGAPTDSGDSPLGAAGVQRKATSMPSWTTVEQVQPRGALAGEPPPVQGAGAIGGSAKDVHAAASHGISGTAGTIPHLAAIQASFGHHDVSGIEAHTDAAAAVGASAMGADAFATGTHVAFGSSSPSLHTAAHEAAHVVQQRQGVSLMGGVGSAGDRYEQHAEQVADLVVRGASAQAALDEVAQGGANGTAAVQRYGDGATGKTDPKALIPVAKLIEYVEAVEKAYPEDAPHQIITRLRIQYYDGAAFQSLIPDAHYDDEYWFLNPDISWNVSRRIDASDVNAVNPEAYGHLAARADENGKGDNPSPYIVLASGERIDLGHMLLGLDALLHPRVGDPYATFGVPSIDPSSWVADIGIAAVWMTQHEETGQCDSPVKLAAPDLEAYYRISAPTEDLLGDADSFGMRDEYGGGAKLSEMLHSYYLGSSSTAAGINRRWQKFASKNGLAFTASGATVSWSATARSNAIEHVDKFNDLFSQGAVGSVWQMLKAKTGGPIPRRAWPHTPTVVDKFLAWVKPKLEAEIASK